MYINAVIFVTFLLSLTCFCKIYEFRKINARENKYRRKLLHVVAALIFQIISSD